MPERSWARLRGRCARRTAHSGIGSVDVASKKMFVERPDADSAPRCLDQCRGRGLTSPRPWFVADSLLEQEGFELVVPPRKGVTISSPTRRAGGPSGWL